MATKTSNWTNFKWPFAPLDEFTRSEPFPSDELKATYIDGRGKPKAKDYSRALRKRWRKVGR